MAATYPDYGSLTVGSTLVNGDSTTAQSIGLSNFAITNGTLTVVADAPSGLTNSLEGTTQGTSGVTYTIITVTGTNTFSLSVYWKMPTSVGTIGAALAWVGASTTRVVQMSLLSTEQIRFVDAGGTTLFTTTYAGAFVAGQWYRTDFHGTVATSTTGRLVTATYAENSTTALANTSYDSGAAINLGASAATVLRNGPRSATGTADENIRTRFGWDTASAYLMGPQPTSVNTTRNLSDTAGATDSVTVTRMIAIADQAGATDSGAQQATGLNVSVTDTAAGSDTTASDRSTTLADTAGATDLATSSRESTVNDSAAGSDVVTVLKALNITVSDTAGGTDSVSGGSASAASVNDAATGSDVVTRQVDASSSLSDVAGATDSATTATTAARDLADTAGGTDAVTVTANTSPNLTDTANGSDAITRDRATPITDMGYASDAVTVVRYVSLVDAALAFDTAVSLLISTTVTLPTRRTLRWNSGQRTLTPTRKGF